MRSADRKAPHGPHLGPTTIAQCVEKCTVVIVSQSRKSRIIPRFYGSGHRKRPVAANDSIVDLVAIRVAVDAARGAVGATAAAESGRVSRKAVLATVAA